MLYDITSKNEYNTRDECEDLFPSIREQIILWLLGLFIDKGVLYIFIREVKT